VPSPVAHLLAELEQRAKARLEELRRHRVLGEVYEILEGTLSDLLFGHGLMYAAAVAFYALLSLIPLVVLFASVAGYVLHFLGGDSPAEMDRLLHDVVVQIERVIPYLGESFENDLRRIIEHRGGLGAFSVIALGLTASQVFRALEVSHAHVFADANGGDAAEPSGEQRAPRNVVLSKLLFGVFVAAVVVGFLALRFVVSLLRTVLERLPETLTAFLRGPLEPGSWMASVVEGVYVISGFAIILKTFTRQHVRLRFSIVGGAAFFGLWQLARELYEVYLHDIADFGALYGSFATVIVIVLWIFYSSIVLLLCSHLVKSLQRRALHGPRYPKGPQQESQATA
jgi:membrane protein